MVMVCRWINPGKLVEVCIPSRKRSVNVQRCLTPIERLQRELCNILKNDPSILSENEEDDLLICNANNLQVSCNEIGLGGFLLKLNTTATAITTTEVAPPPVEPEKHSSAVDIKDSALIESQIDPHHPSAMVDPWWALLGAAIPAIIAGQAFRMKKKSVEEQRLKSARGREKSSDEIFVCERVCTSKRMLKKVGAFSKDPTVDSCVTVCGVSELDACARTFC
ncbi:hypothetical protein GH714_018148 [Hevea brasiliensis]|uniref:Uncharacterized protein n=1 Tax=Hevea brasiliensis TaxID=3981 RepID=A0A6A6N6B4_HEVBR|nr:hypothetical protein GH714_018148 [Hevea brasiliensis]